MPRAKRTGGKATPVETFVHSDDQRSNIPTAELETFMRDEDRAPKEVEYSRSSAQLYPRDPVGDPQLVWHGKDDQDRRPFVVMAPPIYIQEKIHPKAIIDDLRRQSKDAVPAQADLFGDFNGIAFDDLVDFYQHEQHWSNRMVLGDSLEIMTSLVEREGLKGQVQCIYMDPPYGISFGSNWQVSTQRRNVKDGKIEDTTRQPEQVKAFRDTWDDGVHTYLTYLRDRLASAHALLNSTGSIFVQIGEENLHLVRSLLDEVFGAPNFCCVFAFRTKIPLRTTLVPSIYDYILWYARDKPHVKFRRLFKKRDVGAGTQFTWIEEADGTRRRMTEDEAGRPVGGLADGQRAFRLTDLVSAGRTESCVFEFELDGRRFSPTGGKSWKTNPSGMERLISLNRIMAPANAPAYVFYADDYPVQELDNVWSDTQGASDRIYVVQTATKVVERCVLMTTDAGDLVFDPMMGSGTVSYVSELHGRRWIACDTSRIALSLARQRMIVAKLPYWVLNDRSSQRDLRRGFRYRTVPHVTLGSLTRNPAIREGMSRAEVAKAIVDNADHEPVYDQPEVDRSVIRVTGPFTVESLSPLLGLDESAEGAGESAGGESRDFTTTILDNLRAAGVQNSVRGERLTFVRLDAWPGKFVDAAGEYSENGAARRAAVTIGPQYGTVDADLVRDAAKEAAGYFDLLIVCGFAFDSYMANDLKRLGSLTILKVNMNPDLSMGGDLLKKTGAGNLFTVFGEPDIEVRFKGAEIEVEIRGLDVYDPTTGQIRSHTTADIACWFIDTAYDGNSFFVRHAYFTGADDAYKALKAALRADIDEGAWSSLYSTVSRPFEVPASGKVAVKVISHYGDEVMKVYEVAEAKMLQLPQRRYERRIAPAELMVADQEPDRD